MAGFIKIHRKIQEWEWWGNPTMVKVWLQILFDANYEPKPWEGIIVERGQLIYGRVAFAKKCGITEHRSRLCVERLKASNQITIKASNQYSVITVCQYDLYQDKTSESSSETTNEPSNGRPTDVQQTSTPKELKKERTIYSSWTNPEALTHGEHVRLLQTEWDDMVSELGEGRTQAMVDRLNGYIDQIGVQAAKKKYTSHKATLMNWHRKDVSDGKYKPQGVTTGGYEDWTGTGRDRNPAD